MATSGGENPDRVRLALTILTILEGIGTMPMCCIVPFSILGLDKPGNEEKDPAVWPWVGLPVLVLGLMGAAWMLFGKQRFALALAAAGLAGLIELMVFGFFVLTILLVPKAAP